MSKKPEKEKVSFAPGAKDYKILFLSNAVFSPSGYGVQSKGMLYDWVKHYDVRQLSNYGVQGRQIGLNGLVIYPNLAGDDHGDKTARVIFQNWKPDLFFTLYDIWMGAYNEGNPLMPDSLTSIHPRWIPLVMVDHDPVPESTAICASSAYKCISPTRWGTDQLLAKGIDCEYIPFGINTNIWRPPKTEKIKRQQKVGLSAKTIPFNINNQTDITEDSFLIVMNGANKDPYRKAFMRFFIALQIFLENNPDAKTDTRVYVHSWMKLARDIPHGAKTLQVEGYCRAPADYHMVCGVPEDKMVERTNIADLFVHPTQGGGFEIPLLEAMSCGVPVAGTDFVGIPELVKNNGWLIPVKTKYFSALDSTQAIADEFALADIIAEAYNKPKTAEKLGRAGRLKAIREYDWKRVNPMYHRFIEERREEIRYTPMEERRL